MSPLHRLLLLPLLSPLLAVLLMAALNPRPAVTMRLLIWVSPAWPLGAWIGGGAAAGAALSAAATGFALRSNGVELQERRRVRRRRDGDADEGPASQPRDTERRGWSSAWAGPTRSAGEPPPTVSVPFRVIKKGRGTASTGTGVSSGTGTSASAAADSSAGVSHGMNSGINGGDDWDAVATDDW